MLTFVSWGVTNADNALSIILPFHHSDKKTYQYVYFDKDSRLLNGEMKVWDF